jgi:hypothetical protein
MKRAPIIAAAVAALAIPSAALGTIHQPVCTADGYTAQLHNFRDGRQVTVQVKVTATATGQVLHQGPVTFTGPTYQLTGQVPAGVTTVTIAIAWGGPTRPQDTMVVTGPAGCAPIPVPPTAPEPPATPPAPPAPPATPPAPPAQPVKPPAKRTCAQLIAARAGARWTAHCRPVVKRCPAGTVRRTIRPEQGTPRQVCIPRTPPRRPSDNPTG